VLSRSCRAHSPEDLETLTPTLQQQRANCTHLCPVAVCRNKINSNPDPVAVCRNKLNSNPDPKP